MWAYYSFLIIELLLWTKHCPYQETVIMGLWEGNLDQIRKSLVTGWPIREVVALSPLGLCLFSGELGWTHAEQCRALLTSPS